MTTDPAVGDHVHLGDGTPAVVLAVDAGRCHVIATDGTSSVPAPGATARWVPTTDLAGDPDAQ